MSIVARSEQISDEAWALIEPLLPSSAGCRGGQWRDHRQVLEAILWRYRTGSPWRDLPEEFGPWQTVWKRHHRFSLDGTYQQMFDVMRSSYGIDGPDDLAELLSIDSSVVRAHQHAAGAPRTPGKALAGAADNATQSTTDRTGGAVE